jgi:peptide/nickel transport system permease protein
MTPEERIAFVQTAVILFVMIVISQTLTLLPLADPTQIEVSQRLLAPGESGYYWGSDELGRDVMSRVLHGLATTLWISVAAVTTALLIGILVGGIAGMFPGSPIDVFVNWLANLVLSIPFIVVIAAVLSMSEPDITTSYSVLAGLMWVYSARIVRNEIVRKSGLLYVTAARALGTSEFRILRRELLPAATIPAALFAFSYLPEVIALEAALSFVGLGVQPPEPGLGKMIFDGLPYLQSAWWLSTIPALTLFFSVLCANIGIIRLKLSSR